MTCPVASRHALPNADGSIHFGFTAGDKPIGGANLIWAAAGYAVINTLVINHAFAEDQTQFLSGPNAGIATIFVEQVSGDNYVTEDWTIPAGVLSHPSNSNQGAGVFRIGATDGVLTVYQPINREWAYLPPPEIQVKWNPGHYLMMDPNAAITNAMLDDAAAHGFLGIEVFRRWKDIEGARGVYDWAFIDDLLARCKARGLRLIVAILDRGFGTTDPASTFPAYLATEDAGNPGYYVATSSPNSIMPKLYRPAVMNREIALAAAFAARYDTDPYMEGYKSLAETALRSPFPADYSESAYVAQLFVMAEQLPPLFPHTNVWMMMNFGLSQSNIVALKEKLFASRMGGGGPDAITGNADNSDNGSRAIRGLIWNGTAWVSGGIDRRGQLAINHDVEGPEMGGKEGGYSVATIVNQAVTVNGDNHLCWLRKNWNWTNFSFTELFYDNTGRPTPFFTPDIRTAVAAGGIPLVTAKPSYYAAVVTGGT